MQAVVKKVVYSFRYRPGPGQVGREVFHIVLRGGSTSCISHFCEPYRAASVAPMWFFFVWCPALRVCETLWSARDIASVALSAERERDTESVFHIVLRGGSTRLKITWLQQRQHSTAQESARERMLSLALRPMNHIKSIRSQRVKGRLNTNISAQNFLTIFPGNHLTEQTILSLFTYSVCDEKVKKVRTLTHIIVLSVQSIFCNFFHNYRRSSFLATRAQSSKFYLRSRGNWQTSIQCTDFLRQFLFDQNKKTNRSQDNLMTACVKF